MPMGTGYGFDIADALSGIEDMKAPRVANPQVPETNGFNFQQALGNFDDPDSMRALGQVGSLLSQGKPAGQALGDPADQLIRRRGVQKAGSTIAEQLLTAAKEGKLLSDPDDNAKFDSMTIDGKGGGSLKFTNTPKREVIGDQPLTDVPLEAQTGNVNKDLETGGSDLLDFFNPR